ncbi:Titin [Amphibalanus amphitrite]|uniref:Titin n=1 Tax=Amphibalanus amphitrite TaxID=1232801 RepID=A0A6A4WHV5_AMPAM|nr:Titin [Amphibalanus amphitrite]
MQPSRAFETNGARFDVDFVGVPPPEITWFREDFPITPSHDFKASGRRVTTNGRHSTLEIREVYSEDSGQFSCVASNEHGQVRCSANLVVEERPLPHGVQVPPNFTQTPRDVQLWPGTKVVTFEAKLAGTKPVDVYWLKSGDHVEPDGRHKVASDRDTYSLTVLEPTADDCGPIECVAINASGEARCQAELRVAEGPEDTTQPKPKAQGKEVPPKITVPMKGVTVQEGHPATLRCRFSGQPAPTPQWLKDGQPVKPSKYFKIEQDGDTFVLKISECFKEDEGIYTCVATNSAGKSTMKAPLKVTAPKQEIVPTVSPMKDVICMEGEPARFVAKITGKPAPTATWLREGQIIPQSGEFKMTLTGGTAVLEICETYSDDTGTITCRATNGAGTSEASARLTVQSESESESESELDDSGEK